MCMERQSARDCAGILPPWGQRNVCPDFATIHRRLRSPFACGGSDLPLPKPAKSTILCSKPPWIWRMSMKQLLLAGPALLALVSSHPSAEAAPVVFDFTFTGSIVDFAVPTTDTYQLLAFGAQGGDSAFGGTGGRGAEIGGDFSLTAGDALQIAVGGAGMSSNDGGGAGGGGTFVIGPGNAPLVIAGGGGGGGIFGPGGVPAKVVSPVRTGVPAASAKGPARGAMVEAVPGAVAAVAFSTLVLTAPRLTVVAHSLVSLGAQALPAAASVGAEAVEPALAVPVGAEAIAAVAAPSSMVAASGLLTQVAVVAPSMPA
jgi:hypothetical protein